VRGNETLVLALPKGRILKQVVPMLARTGIEIEPEFGDEDSRQLRFKTNIDGLDVIRVRNFDVATFVAFGAAHMGIAGYDVLMEFAYPEIYAPLDLKVGQCRLAVAGPPHLLASDEPTRWSHVRVATKSPHIPTRSVGARGLPAE
jgi:ATP phosphoribosyltransferase